MCLEKFVLYTKTIVFTTVRKVVVAVRELVLRVIFAVKIFQSRGHVQEVVYLHLGDIGPEVVNQFCPIDVLPVT